MALALNARSIGKVTVVQCCGRILAGSEMEALRSRITSMMQERKDFILHLGEVSFIDSSGLGTMVGLLTSTRRRYGDLKLCNLPEVIDKILRMTSLHTLFDIHQSEESAISAFYRRAAPEPATASVSPVLCVDNSSDILSYLRELLKRAGYSVHTSGNLHDALILLRVTQPVLVLLGLNRTESPATRQPFDAACTRLPLVEPGNDFSTLEAGEAASRLLASIQARLQQKPALNS